MADSRSNSTIFKAASCARGPRRMRRRTSCFGSTTARRDGVDAPAAHGRDFGRATATVLTRYLGKRRAHAIQGLKALGVPQTSLESFPPEFQQGMAARAKPLGDIGESSPEHWEKPLGTVGCPRGAGRRRAGYGAARSGAGARPRSATRSSRDHGDLAPGLPCAARRKRGLRLQGRHQSSGDRRKRHSRDQSHERPLKAGEFVLGYPDEMGGAREPQPEVLGRNGTLCRLPQAAPAGCGVPPVSEGERQRRRGGGIAGGQDDGPLAQRRAARALSVARRSRAWRGPAAQQRFSVSRRTIRSDIRRRADRTSAG